jgi:hypothetical protein
VTKPRDPRSQRSLSPTTTAAEDVTHAGQRRINLIWEYTQAAIALVVVVVALGAALLAMWQGKEVSAFLSFVCGNVVGFYFSRTNHEKVGGVGPKAQNDQSFLGR